MQDTVRLLVTFPETANIQELAAQLRNNYTYPQEVQIIGPTKLSCSFETMADLLEIDFFNTFGATATKVINSRTFSQEMNLHNQDFDDSFNCSDSSVFSSLGQFPNGTLLEEELCMKKVVPRKIQMLTSLEDQVVEEEKLKQMLTLYNSDQQVVIWQKALALKEKDQILQDSTISHSSLQSHQEIPVKNEQSAWRPFIGGLALTSVLVGGFKLMRMVLG